MTQELAESVKRLRQQAELVPALKRSEFIQTINQLVQLVGEMRQYLSNAREAIIYTGELQHADESMLIAFASLEGALTKSAPIAELEKEGK